jgi:putative hemolysin
MLRVQRGTWQAENLRLVVGFAHTASEVKEAQRLRWKIFAEELGARLSTDEPGVDRDRFDPFCEHLLVRDSTTNEVVGTYRVLTPGGARYTNGLYADTEFDLSRLANIREQMLELGRACVHPDYRAGATIALLWAGLADLIQRHGFQYLIGCASISMADGGHLAASIFKRMRKEHMGPSEWRVFPRCSLPLAALNSNLPVEIPPLIKAYLRVGGFVCGAPAWDPDFNTADLVILLPTSHVDHRYARHFLKTAEKIL